VCFYFVNRIHPKFKFDLNLDWFELAKRFEN
jgi:hypothetical protein